jgi:hypothetical protein
MSKALCLFLARCLSLPRPRSIRLSLLVNHLAVSLLDKVYPPKEVFRP